MGERQYRPDIDGLRAIAILSVVLCHAGIPRLTGGFTGVDIFFVISGYLIGGHIFAEARAGRFSFLRFYQRRARRILPAFFVVTAFTLAAGMLLLSPQEAARTGREGCAAVLSASNILFWHGANYFDVRSELHPFLMTWSLGVEEQFYAVIPWLMVLLARARRGAALPAILAACAVSFIASWSLLATHPAFAFYMLPTRAWELGAGVALAVAEIAPAAWMKAMPARVAQLIVQTSAWAGLALILAPMMLLTAQSPFPGPFALPSVLGTALLIGLPSSWLNRRLLSWPPLAFVGRISYSWYLVHWPLQAFAHIEFGATPPRAVSLVLIAASFALAVLSYYFVETPFRRSRTAAAPLLLRYGAVCSALIAVCALVWLSHGIPQRFAQLAQMEAGDAPLASDECLADEESAKPDRSPRCFDAADARPAVALWGDSHAAALAPGLRALASAQGYSFIELTKASCAPLIGATHFVPSHPLLAETCVRYNHRVLDVLAATSSARIVVLNASWAGYLHRDWQDGWLVSATANARQAPNADRTRPLFAASLAASVHALKAAGKQVIVMNDIPAFDFEPLWRVRTARIPLRHVLAKGLRVPDASDPGFGLANDAPNVAAASALLETTLASLPGVSLIDLKAAFCNPGGNCAYRDGDRMLYIDNNHLSEAGARFALQSFRLPELYDTSSSGRKSAL